MLSKFPPNMLENLCLICKLVSYRTFKGPDETFPKSSPDMPVTPKKHPVGFGHILETRAFYENHSTEKW